MAKRKGKNKVTIKGIPAVIVTVLLLAGGYLNLDDLASLVDSGQIEVADTVATGEMRVTFLDVGQGDCTIIQTEEHTAMIDAGNNDKGEQVVEYLESQGIEKLDYLIFTHPDADHIGGGDDVLENVAVEKVIMPELANDTITYEEVVESIEANQVEVIYPQVNDKYALGDAEFTVLCPEADDIKESDMNGASIGVKLVHGEKSFIMCGDAEEDAEESMVETFGDSLECDVLKCGHHGSSTATTEEFLKAADPVWAVVSSGKDNSYGHPHAEVIDRLENEDVQIYRTDEMGTIVAESDGKNITWKSEKKM